MAMVDEDTIVLSDEDHAMESIEHSNGNGDHAATVNPSKLLFHAASPDLLSPVLPFHGLGNPLKGSPSRKTLNAQDYSSSSPGVLSHDRQSQNAAPIDPDSMDVIPAKLARVEVRVPPPPRFKPLPYPSSRTGLVYDDRMRFHAEDENLNSNPDDIHPEDPRRIYAIFHEIRQAGLVREDSIDSDDEDAESRDNKCWRIHTRHATKAEICLIHTPEHYLFVEALQNKTPLELQALYREMDSIYFNNSTFDSALLAAGGAIEACRAVVMGHVRNAIAIIRPPGHHAESTEPSGFCIFNNVPIAARVCQNDFPETCRKIIILDWDVHHGNGIQHAFYDDPNILYISLHVFRGGSFYPGNPDGDLTYCGEGPGLGRNVNIPWEEHHMGDAEYIYAFQQIVIPIVSEFDPDLVIISAGFDAAEGDALGSCHVTPAGYAHMTHMLMRVAEGKMAVCLEGGYNLRSISRSALAVTRTLMLQPPDRLADDLNPKESAVRVVEQVKRVQSKFWKCMYPKHFDAATPAFPSTTRLHDILRKFQSLNLAEENRMTPLQIIRDDLRESFEHNVVATPNFTEKRPLLVIFHDPPTLTFSPDPVTGKIELHNIWMADVVEKNYIEWAIRNGFEVIDVNVPKIEPIPDDEGEFIHSDTHEERAEKTKQLASYIWENYIEPFEATQVFFLGIGSAYIGLVDLLRNNETCTDDNSIVESLIAFVADTSIQSIKRATEDNVADWYYSHSKIFVQNNHLCWDPTRARKHRKKWGKLIRSEHVQIDDMLMQHMKEVHEYLLEKKAAFVDHGDDNTSVEDNSQQQPLRSPPLPSGLRSPQGSVPLSRNGNGDEARSRLPPIAYFNVPNSRTGTLSPTTPGSPLRQGFGRG
ncbi:Histone deacetylase hda1 [Paraconiothyrium brasiliense]|uniref:histone deacetylase n=1 Tax=Paraconiothyrium brasiliense TaxID=300254 RepID=A0ABR3RAY9_9PLEO